MKHLEHIRTEFEGKKFQVVTGTIPGKQSKMELVKHIGAVVMLPLLDNETILLIQNNRWAIGETLYELPAGTLEKNEKPANTAYRELEEETGYAAKKMTSLIDFYPTPGYCTEKLYGFLAEDLSFVGQRLEENEEIIVEEVSLKKSIQMIYNKEVIDAKTISILLYYYCKLNSL